MGHQRRAYFVRRTRTTKAEGGAENALLRTSPGWGTERNRRKKYLSRISPEFSRVPHRRKQSCARE